MRIKKLNKTQAEVLMYGNVGGWFVDGFNFASIIDDLESQGITETTFRIHSYGGSVFEGNVISAAFARSKMKINLVIDGIAASMACMILPSVPVENVSIADNAFGMIHRPVGGQRGNASQLLSEAKLLMDIEGNFIRTLSQRTGLSADKIKADFFDGNDHWLNADKMIEYKLVGNKIPSVASIVQLDKQTIEQMTEQAAYGHFAAKLDSGADIPHNKTNLQMKKELIEAFQLKGVTADSSDTAVIAALQAMFKGTEDRLKALETKAKAEKAAAIKSALDTAQSAGLITAELRPTYEAIGENSGVEALNTVLGGMGKKTPIAQTIKPGGKGKGGQDNQKDWNWYQENDPQALEEMPVNDPETFKALYKAEFKTDPPE